jgi:hypothetical protein
MRPVPKVVNKIPLYLFLLLLVGIFTFLITGNFKLQVVNVYADPETPSTNFSEYTAHDLVTLKDLIKDDKTIVLVKSSWCSNCNYMEVELKNFLTNHQDFKGYMLDLDEYRNILLAAEIDQAPTIVRTISGELFIQQSISISEFNDLIDRELLGL